MARIGGIFLLCALIVLAGCAGTPDATTPTDAGIGEPGAVDPNLPMYIHVQVVDVEIVPIEGVAVLVTPGDHLALTSANGTVSVGPLDPGQYVVSVDRQGYAATEKSVFLTEDVPVRLTFTLTPTATNVPYFETTLKVTFIQCGIGSSIPDPVGGSANIPCTAMNVNYQTGQNVTSDSDVFLLQITQPNLANLVVETQWQPQVYAHDMLFAIVGKGQVNTAISAGGVASFEYRVRNQGGPPLTTWVTPGIVNPGGSVPFDGNVSAEYDAVARGIARNSTFEIVALYLDHRVNNYLTFFYNRPGSPDFSALPDQ